MANKACASLGSRSMYTITLSKVSFVALHIIFDTTRQTDAPLVGTIAVSGFATISLKVGMVLSSLRMFIMSIVALSPITPISAWYSTSSDRCLHRFSMVLAASKLRGVTNAERCVLGS